MCNLQNNDLLCSKCRCQRDKLFKYIDMKNSVTMATLGPEGTTSSEAAKVFKKYIETRNQQANLKIDLYNSFELALNEIHKRNADFILLPNAYGKMTYFYWDTTIELGFTFINKTPEYGIAMLDKKNLYDKPTLSISTCKAVEHLLQELMDTTEFRYKNYEIVEANSTTESLMLLEDGKVDLALTNDTSLKNSEAYFISKTKSTEVLWSVFMLKTV
ncbi:MULTISPECIES: hypothetical protein [Acetivibrio]|uniref:hypothetical protein n=1 Tax=Acetivibrio TaxID=35829 RepID=UPI00223FCBAD|nr:MULTISPECIES: hypothetical protein [Acetivibrio]HOM02663.1 hypothetical protein [Acetivibrio sp.]HOV25705.1 hypothetical protein [Pseudobacteroides sp.]